MSYFYTRETLPAHFCTELAHLDGVFTSSGAVYKGFVTHARYLTLWMDKQMKICAKMEFDNKCSVYHVHYLTVSDEMGKMLQNFERTLLQKTPCTEIRLRVFIDGSVSESEKLQQLKCYEALRYGIYKLRIEEDGLRLTYHKVLRIT